MAQVDARIALGGQGPQIRDPLEVYGNALNIQNAQSANALREQTMREHTEDRTRAEQRRQGINALLARPDLTEETLGPALIRGGYIDEGTKVAKDLRESRSHQATADKTTTETKITKGKRALELLSAATDQESWTAVRDAMGQELGPDALARFPVQFDPKLRDTMAKATLTELQRLTNERERMNANVIMGPNGPQVNPVAVGARTQIAAAGAAQAPMPIQVVPTSTGLTAVTTRVPAGTTEPQITAAPILTPGGQQAQPVPTAGAQPTEDERKAAGWLSQAGNAFTNMQNIVAKSPSAGQPGVGDAFKQVGWETLGQWFTPADRQLFTQGASSLSEALLRAATGAGINIYEAKQKVAELTPQIGDKPPVLQQKMDAIPIYLESLKVRAGRAAPKGPTEAEFMAAYNATPVGGTYTAPDGTKRTKTQQ